jgi:hypothetical protein
MFPAPYRASDRFLDQIDRYVEAGLETFPGTAPRSASSGSRTLGRASPASALGGLPMPDSGARRWPERWARSCLRTSFFPDQDPSNGRTTRQNPNTIPPVAWMLMELHRDGTLLDAVREEVASAFVTDLAGVRTLDVQKAVKLPLLQSLLTEILRLRVSNVVMRVVEEPMTVGGVHMTKGSLIHAYSGLAQTWAERHIQIVEERDQTGQPRTRREFAMGGQPCRFFPLWYVSRLLVIRTRTDRTPGGGVPICPGCQFARSEILTMVGILVDRFDMEFVCRTNLDGSPSDRPAESSQRFTGIGPCLLIAT